MASQSILTAAGNAIDRSISNFFHRIGYFCCSRPKLTIALTLAVSILCAGGMAKLTPENRPDKLWIPQGTLAESEKEVRRELFVVLFVGL
jgi:predicted RND superfamily exporter protein